MTKNHRYTISSGNVFADLGFDQAEEKLAKAELARQINNLLKRKNLTQIAAAKLLGVDQPKISALSQGKLAGFSLERLFTFLNILGQDITIKITPKKRANQRANTKVSIPSVTRQSPTAKKQPQTSEKSISIQARKKNQ